MADPSAALYWLETWNAQISTVVGAFASLCGVFALFAAGVSCKLAGLLQIATGLLVVAIEGPNFLPQLAFAAPAGAMLEGKPSWIKVRIIDHEMIAYHLEQARSILTTKLIILHHLPIISSGCTLRSAHDYPGLCRLFQGLHFGFHSLGTSDSRARPPVVRPSAAV